MLHNRKDYNFKYRDIFAKKKLGICLDLDNKWIIEGKNKFQTSG